MTGYVPNLPTGCRNILLEREDSHMAPLLPWSLYYVIHTCFSCSAQIPKSSLNQEGTSRNREQESE